MSLFRRGITDAQLDKILAFAKENGLPVQIFLAPCKIQFASGGGAKIVDGDDNQSSDYSVAKKVA